MTTIQLLKLLSQLKRNRKSQTLKLLCFDLQLMYHMSWDYHVVMMSLVSDYSTTFIQQVIVTHTITGTSSISGVIAS
jgi:hypothetical protein